MSGRKGPKPFTCPFCKKGGHFPVNCPEVECFDCGAKGHLAVDCPAPRCRFCGGSGHRRSECAKYVSRKRRRPADSVAPASGGQASGPSGPTGCSRALSSLRVPGTSRSMAEIVAGSAPSPVEKRVLGVQEHVDGFLGVMQGLLDPEAMNQRRRSLEEREKRLREQFERDMAALEEERAALERDVKMAELYGESVHGLLAVHKEGLKRRRVDSSADGVVAGDLGSAAPSAVVESEAQGELSEPLESSREDAADAPEVDQGAESGSPGTAEATRLLKDCSIESDESS